MRDDCTPLYTQLIRSALRAPRRDAGRATGRARRQNRALTASNSSQATSHIVHVALYRASSSWLYANTPPYTPIYTAVYANKTPIGNRRIRIDATRVGVSLSESPVPVSRCVRPTGEWRPSGAPAARARGAPIQHYNDNRGLPACSSSPLSCIAHSLAYSPLSASNSACVPRSTTVPSRTTRMQSASTTVESRWAIMMHV